MADYTYWVDSSHVYFHITGQILQVEQSYEADWLYEPDWSPFDIYDDIRIYINRPHGTYLRCLKLLDDIQSIFNIDSTGTHYAPPAPEGLRGKALNSSVLLNWNEVKSAWFTEVLYSTTDDISTAILYRRIHNNWYIYFSSPGNPDLDDPANYRIEPNYINPWNPAMYSHPVTESSVTGLTNETTYYFWVKSVNLDGSTATSSISLTPTSVPQDPVISFPLKDTYDSMFENHGNSLNIRKYLLNPEWSSPTDSIPRRDQTVNNYPIANMTNYVQKGFIKYVSVTEETKIGYAYRYGKLGNDTQHYNDTLTSVQGGRNIVNLYLPFNEVTSDIFNLNYYIQYGSSSSYNYGRDVVIFQWRQQWYSALGVKLYKIQDKGLYYEIDGQVISNNHYPFEFIYDKNGIVKFREYYTRVTGVEDITLDLDE